MVVFLSKSDKGVFVQMGASSPGGIVGDVSRDLSPSDDFNGYSGAELLALGNGKHELEDRPLKPPRPGQLPKPTGS